MTWRDRYLAGSFRGAPFLTEGHDTDGGRRGVSHSFPGRDDPWFEDLGRAARRVSLQCFVIGPDYMAARDALIDALEAPGAGVLVHPYRGQMDMAVTDFRYSESTAEGGMARFSIDFAEPGKLAAGAINTDTAALAQDQAAAVQDAAPAQFAARFSLADMPAFVEGAAADAVKSITSSARDAARALGGAGKALAAYEAGLRALDGATALVRTPFDLALGVRAMIHSVGGLAVAPLLRVRALRRMMRDTANWTAPIGQTPVRLRERLNQAALRDLTVTLAAAEAVTAMAQARFASYPEALSARDGLADEIDAFALDAGERGADTQMRLLDSLRQAMVRDVTTRGATLARVFSFRPAETEPVLVLAQRIYGREALADRLDEIVGRNRLAHPGFVPGGISIELLTPDGLGVANG